MTIIDWFTNETVHIVTANRLCGMVVTGGLEPMFRYKSFCILGISCFIASVSLNSVGYAKADCVLKTRNSSYAVVSSNDSLINKIYFRSLGSLHRNVRTSKVAYLIPGDLVMTDPSDLAEKFSGDYRCVKYKSSKGAIKQGLIANENIISLTEGDRAKDYPEIPARLKEALKLFPQNKSVTKTLKRDGEDDKFIIKLSSDASMQVANYGGTKYEFKNRIAKSLSGRCSLLLILLNGSVFVKSKVDGTCWGSHGYSDPQGAYF